MKKIGKFVKFMKDGKIRRNGESGTTLVVTLMMMVIITLIGLAAVLTSSVDIRISGNEAVQKQALYAADAGLNYARVTAPFIFVDQENTQTTLDNPTGFPSTFHVDIAFGVPDRGITFTNPPAGSGTGVRQGQRAIHYLVTSSGFSANQAQKTLEMQGYRIGYEE